MRRIGVSVLVLSAFTVPASADPLQITPQAYNAVRPQPTSAAPPSAGRTYAAPQPNLGGGFIEFLFRGAGDLASAPPASRVPADMQAPPDSRQASFSVNDPGGADADWTDAQHPPVDPKYDRQVVPYQGKEPPGTIVIDTPNKFLYL